jgi:pimeloyl-ACP methyl ester carboxylesterase
MIEYAEAGDGPAVLVIHGAGGGFDQGLALASSFVPQGYRVIAMSRFGYLRTPAPARASLALQADAHACLLDALGVKQAAVIGVSAGAPSALELALRHADRCTALTLVVPGWFVSPERAPRRFDPLTEVIFARVLRSDFAFWGFSRFFPTTAIRTVLGTPPDIVVAAGPDEQARVESMLWNILPISQRSAGLSLEGGLTVERLSEPLSLINAPTLIISARDDLYGTYENAQFIARGVPHGRLIGYPVGGHLLIGHSDEVRAAIAELLANASW